MPSLWRGTDDTSGRARAGVGTGVVSECLRPPLSADPHQVVRCPENRMGTITSMLWMEDAARLSLRTSRIDAPYPYIADLLVLRCIVVTGRRQGRPWVTNPLIFC